MPRTSAHCWACSDRDVLYYECFSFESRREGHDILGVYASASTFEAEVWDRGHRAMYRRARDCYVSRGPLAEHLSEAKILPSANRGVPSSIRGGSKAATSWLLR